MQANKNYKSNMADKGSIEMAAERLAEICIAYIEAKRNKQKKVAHVAIINNENEIQK